MMKKLFLLSVVGALGALNASAQLLSGSSIVSLNNETQTLSNSPSFNTSGVISKDFSYGNKSTSTAKTTAGGSRWYNYIEYLNKLDGDLLGIKTGTTSRYVLPLIWNNPKTIVGWTDGPDTVQFVSYGSVFDPTFPGFNDKDAYSTELSSIAVQKGNPYTLDSVRVWGIYTRNAAKPAIVDTLRLAFVYGRNSGSNLFAKNYYYGGSTASFGVDRAYFPALFHDTIANRAASLVGAPLVVVKDIYLTAASLDDTGLVAGDGWNAYATKVPSLPSPATGFDVPANNMSGFSVTYISGDNSLGAYDTINLVTPNVNTFRPLYFEENKGAYPAYYGYGKYTDTTEAHYNMGYISFYPYTNYEQIYVPSYGLTGPSSVETPYIDYKVSCATCKSISEVSSIKENTTLSVINAFPNPANTQLNVPVSVSETANVTVSISNMLGQVIATQNLGSMNAGQNQTAVFNTATLSAGVYLYTVEANGQRVSNRFSVSH